MAYFNILKQMKKDFIKSEVLIGDNDSLDILINIQVVGSGRAANSLLLIK